MKMSKNHLAEKVYAGGSKREATREVENFLLALDSYPDQFAHNPRLSFQQYFCAVGEASSVLVAANARSN
jgi:hypothetical protein